MVAATDALNSPVEAGEPIRAKIGYVLLFS